MVTINLTLLIELGLFLVFLWVTNKFILMPTLRLLDEREGMIGHNQEQTEKDEREAETLEEQYKQEVYAVHRAAEERFRDARRAAMNQHAQAIAQEREAAEQQILALRKAATDRVAEQRDKVKELAPTLAEEIAEQLGLSETAS